MTLHRIGNKPFTWTNADAIYWCIYAALGGDGLKKFLLNILLRWIYQQNIFICLQNNFSEQFFFHKKIFLLTGITRANEDPTHSKNV